MRRSISPAFPSIEQPEGPMPASRKGGPPSLSEHRSGHLQASSPPSASVAGSTMRNLNIAARSSSPCKRTISDRDNEDDIGTTPRRQSVTDAAQPGTPSTFEAMQHVSPMPTRMKKEEGSTSGSKLNFAPGNQHFIVHGPDSTTSSSSLQDIDPSSTSSLSTPATSIENDSTSVAEKVRPSSMTLSFDQQVETIKSIMQKQDFKEGSKGFVISNRWLARVQSRTTQGRIEGHPKEAREGDVGSVNNSDIVGTFNINLRDEVGEVFVPLRLGLQMQEDFEVLPQEAWNLVLEWYGCAPGSTISRYAHNTSNGAVPNWQYELFPPVLTIRKLGNDSGGSVIDQGRPASQLVASRSESIQSFLKRAKAAVGIEMDTRIRVWRALETPEARDGRSTIPTPAASRNPSPVSVSITSQSLPPLVVDLHAFRALEEGGQRERLDMMSDQGTEEEAASGFTLAVIGFSEEETLIFEEQTHASATVEFISDQIKKDAALQGTTLGSAKHDHLTVQDRSKPKANSGSVRRSPTPSGMMTRGRMSKKGRTSGTTGLQNLGNTCYMNSALQCLRSVEELTTYFLSEYYKTELNAANPLGYNGQMAKAYAGVLAGIFGDGGSFGPRNFKTALSRCQPLFSGYGQQDSQEFLSFLVDALHEDLNRIHQKPYIENPESDDGTVHDPEAIRQLGDKYRINHKARNDSVAMDLFNGFYKNTMVCPVCDKISVTFDPYLSLTLQLPVQTTWQHTVTYAPLHGPPINVRVDINKNSSIRMLKEHVAAKFPGLKAENLIMGENYNEKFYKIFKDTDIIVDSNIQAADKLWLFELDEKPSNWPPRSKKKKPNQGIYTFSNNSVDDVPGMESEIAEYMAFPVIHRLKNSEGRTAFAHQLYPSFVLINREEAKDYDSILRKVLQKVETMTTREMFPTEESAHEESPSKAKSLAEFTVDDIPSSGARRIEARSVEGEDDVVDVTMADNHDVRGSDGNTSASKDKSTTSKQRQSTVLNPAYFIDPAIRNLFDMHYYSSTSELVPSNYSSLNDNQGYPLIHSRIIPRRDSRSSASSWGSRSSDTLDPQSSDDELAGNGSEHRTMDLFQSPLLSDRDSNDDEAPPPSIPRRKLFNGISHTRKNTTTYLARRRRKPQSSTGKSALENSYLLRLGDGIILDWNPEGFNQLFEGVGTEDERGKPTAEDIPTLSDPELDAKKAKRAARNKNGVSLEECFEETSKSEILSEENAWYCGRCKELRRATKTLEIWTVPDILVIHLKRFSSTSRLRDKIDVLVDFPVEGLDLEGRVGLPEDKSLQYDLFAVDCHWGGLGGGHYTAYAQNFYDHKWYEYNDAQVSSTSPSAVVTRNAYLLFYRRRTDTPNGPQYLQDIVNKARNPPSRPSSLSGEDQRRDDSCSPNGSSSGSIGAAAEAEASHPQAGVQVGSRLGFSGPENVVRNALPSETGPPPSYNAYDEDEAIDMNDPDDPIPSHEENQGVPQFHTASIVPNWTWGNIGQDTAVRQGSDNEMDSDTLAASDAPALGSDVGEMRMLEDFGDDLEAEQRGLVHPWGRRSAESASPELEIEERLAGGNVRHLEHVHDVASASVAEDSEVEGSVVEVRVDEDEGA